MDNITFQQVERCLSGRYLSDSRLNHTRYHLFQFAALPLLRYLSDIMVSEIVLEAAQVLLFLRTSVN